MNLAKALRAPWLVVLRKELIETLRDRRSLSLALLLGPLIGPVLFSIITGFVVAKQLRDAEAPLRVPVIGAQNAPNLVAYLQQQGMEVLDPPQDPEGAIRDQVYPVILRIPAGFKRAWDAGEPAVIELLHDASRQNAETPYQRTKALISDYTTQIGALRLLVRGVSPVVATPLALADRDLSTPQSRAGILLAMLPYFLVLSIFIGGMHLAIDVTAGERERQSLEPLLLTPVPRDQIVIGKLLAVSVFSLLSAAIGVAAFSFCLRFVRTDDLGFDLRLPVLPALLIWLTAAPLAPLAAALQTLTAARAKTFREAQSYMQVMMLLPLVPSLMQIIDPVKPPDWMYGVPLFNQSVLIGSLARGESLSWPMFAMCWITTLAAALLLSIAAVAAYRRERVAFGLP